jgi:hypothetical protein
MLYSERKRQRSLAEREAKGETFWTSHFDKRVRQKLKYLLDECGEGDNAAQRARYLILKDEGLPYLYTDTSNEVWDFELYLFECSDEMMPTVIEAMFRAIVGLARSQVSRVGQGRVIAFINGVNEVLRAHRISFEFQDGEMVPFESKALHATVLAPALTLLRDPRFEKADRAYRDAMDELTRGTPGDAITDAATALQEMLVALGASGNALGPLLKSARSMGLLAAHDAILTEALQKTIDWVSADRSNLGDAHKADSAEVQDGWFTVHVVGALIVRLAGPKRIVP